MVRVGKGVSKTGKAKLSVVPEVLEADDAEGDNRPIRYIEAIDGEETVVYRASGLGACLRIFAAYANKHVPEPTPEWLQEVFDEGKRIEPVIRAMYEEEYGVAIIGDQREVTLDLGIIEGRPVIVRGHIDGQVQGLPVLFEAKKFRESTWDKFMLKGVECNVNYPWQVATYMIAEDLDDCEFTGGLLNEDGDGIDKIHTIHLNMPPVNLKAIRSRVAHIEKLIALGFDAREVECNKTTYPCPFWKLHDEDEDPWEIPDIERARIVLTGWKEATEVKAALDAKLKEVDAERAEWAQQLKELLIETGGDNESKLIGKLSDGSDFELLRIKKTIPEHVRKASEQDYFQRKPAPRKKAQGKAEE